MRCAAKNACSGSSCSGCTPIRKRFGASGGALRRQASTRSLRVKVSSSTAVRPSARLAICTALPRVAPQVGEAVAQRRVRDPGETTFWCVSNRPRPRHHEKDRHRAAKPPTTVRPSFRSPACHTRSAAKRRQSGGVRGERAALRRARLAAHDAHRGHVLELHERRQREAEQQHQPDEEALHRGQRARRRQLRAHDLRHRGRDRLLRDEADDAARGARGEPEHHELDRVEAQSCACVAPRQRITAQPSRCRSTKRRVPSATATPARIAASSAVRPRKRCARSTAERTSGRPVSRLSIRWPRLELDGIFRAI